MTSADYIVLAVYFLVLVAIGLYCARLNKKQEDYFMGGRGFGKLMQTFAAFGAGTGPQAVSYTHLTLPTNREV